MKGIVLKDSIELFGLKNGFSFWFRWSFTDEIKMWIHDIQKKGYCSQHGYFCPKNCTKRKIFSKKYKERIIREEWKELK